MVLDLQKEKYHILKKALNASNIISQQHPICNAFFVTMDGKYVSHNEIYRDSSLELSSELSELVSTTLVAKILASYDGFNR